VEDFLVLFQRVSETEEPPGEAYARIDQINALYSKLSDFQGTKESNLMIDIEIQYRFCMYIALQT